MNGGGQEDTEEKGVEGTLEGWGEEEKDGEWKGGR